ncbi:sulfatase family protein [Vallitalea okinawensis]|uniref:sulfatase family protein n=1 Tax=Vallitalea okinawensis TaxID=2078660 RepID=UPI000CFCA45A|nr:sulfatase [Vallitalea okinawensis]
MNTNILFITVDDMNYDSIGLYNEKSITPNIDKLLKEGLFFKHAHVNVSVCQPSRQCIMTGKYPHNNGSHGFSPISHSVNTLQELLLEKGYINGIISKVGHLAPIHKYCWDYIKEFNNKKYYWGRKPEYYYQCSKEFFDRVKNQEQPFFLMVNSNDPHRPFAGSQQELDKFGVNTEASRTWESEEVEVPGFLPDIPDVRKEIAQYCTSVHRADQSIGCVLQALDESGFADNTIVMFLSDNGMAFPFAKTNCYLNSTKTPLIIKWPNIIEPESVDEDNIVTGVDIMPTILDIMDIPYNEKDYDGRSFMNVLLGKNDERKRDKAFTLFNANFKRMNFEMRSVLTKKYGYIFNEWSDGESRFFNESMSGLTFKAMEREGQNNPDVDQRVKMFLYREKEEFYNFENDPNGLVNLINDETYKNIIDEYKNFLYEDMKRSNDPRLKAFESMCIAGNSTPSKGRI